MAALAKRLTGKLFVNNERGIVLLGNGSSIYLRFALVLQGSGTMLFPELLLDDWGHELHTLELYHWIHKNGDRFPRAELFGYDFEGNDRQCFLREIDLIAKYPCYAYRQFGDLLSTGVELLSLMLAVEGLSSEERLDDLSRQPWPLRNAKVSWWQISNRGSEGLARRLLQNDETTLVDTRRSN